MDDTRRSIGLKMLDIAGVALPEHPRLKAIFHRYAEATDQACRDAVTLEFLAEVFHAIKPPPPKPPDSDPPHVAARKSIRDRKEGRMICALIKMKEGGKHTRQEAADLLADKGRLGLTSKTIRDEYMPRVFPAKHPYYGDCWKPGTPSFWGGAEIDFGGNIFDPSGD